MNDAEESAPERYREIAQRLRELAEQTPVREIEADLTALALHFERIAADLEAQRGPE